MLGSAAEKVTWMARTTTTVVGLAIMLALVFGVATTALAGTGVGARFDLGKTNTVNAVTRLVGSVAGPSLDRQRLHGRQRDGPRPSGGAGQGADERQLRRTGRQPQRRQDRRAGLERVYARQDLPGGQADSGRRRVLDRRPLRHRRSGHQQRVGGQERHHGDNHGGAERVQPGGRDFLIDNTSELVDDLTLMAVCADVPPQR